MLSPKRLPGMLVACEQKLTQSFPSKTGYYFIKELFNDVALIRLLCGISRAKNKTGPDCGKQKII